MLAHFSNVNDSQLAVATLKIAGDSNIKKQIRGISPVWQLFAAKKLPLAS